MGWESSWGYPPYVRVAERKKQAAKKLAQLKKKGHDVQPIVIEGRLIARTFWGKAWCKHLEAYSDYETRLPRGRTYVRNGSVIDLKLKAGNIKALVSGSSIYKVDITIDPIAPSKWEGLLKECSGKIDSLIELLQGSFSKGVMEILTHAEKGLFPGPQEIKLKCSCYDWADMCKHVAEVLYGIGARLDEQPEDLFLLRHVDHQALLAQAGSAILSDTTSNQTTKKVEGDLSALFGIDIEDTPQEIKAKAKDPVQRPRQKRKKGLKAKPPTLPKKVKPPLESSKAKSPQKSTKNLLLKRKQQL